MFCPKCRTELPEDSRFCRICGAALSRVGAYSPAASKRGPVDPGPLGPAVAQTPFPPPPPLWPETHPRDLPPTPIRRHRSGMKRRHHRKWYKKLGGSMAESLPDILKVIGLGIGAVVMYMILRG